MKTAAGTVRSSSQHDQCFAKSGYSLFFLFLTLGVFAADIGLFLSRLTEDFNVATSASQRIARQVLLPATTQDIPQEMASATQGWLKALNTPASAAQSPDTLYLIVVESWGEIKSDALMQRRLALFRTPSLVKNFNVQNIRLPFAGSTVPAEMRELCGVRSISIHPDVSQFEKTACLPLLAKSHGYQTHALHNYRGSFFMRYMLYPELGFDQAHFIGTMRKSLPEARFCGKTFRNLCDEYVPHYIRQIEQKNINGKNLIYWLTVSSHIPAKALSEEVEAAYCISSLLQQERDLCAQEYRVEKTLQSIAAFLSEKAAEGENYAAIVVGDHAPPFLRLSLQQMYSDDHVPGVLITPKAKDAPDEKRQPVVLRNEAAHRGRRLDQSGIKPGHEAGEHP